MPSFGGICNPAAAEERILIRYGVANPVLDRDGLQIRHNWEGSWVIKRSKLSIMNYKL